MSILVRLEIVKPFKIVPAQITHKPVNECMIRGHLSLKPTRIAKITCHIHAAVILQWHWKHFVTPIFGTYGKTLLSFCQTVQRQFAMDSTQFCCCYSDTIKLHQVWILINPWPNKEVACASFLSAWQLEFPQWVCCVSICPPIADSIVGRYSKFKPAEKNFGWFNGQRHVHS